MERENIHNLAQKFGEVRKETERICEPLLVEDYGVQPMVDVSPPKWHLAHTTWFFEEFVLKRAIKNYKIFNESFSFLFNSYYETVGKRVDRDKRGLLSRPSVEEVYQYRNHVTSLILEWINSTSITSHDGIELLNSLILGINHEQQHQELLVTDIKNIFWNNPLKPVYVDDNLDSPDVYIPREKWLSYKVGLTQIGYDPTQKGDFAFDNETPRHSEFVHDFEISARLITNGEFQEFIEDGGYSRPTLWLSDGWTAVQKHKWEAPLYWQRIDGGWQHMTMHGMKPVRSDEPVTHLSYYEADAFARWKDARLPTEAEWETVAEDVPLQGNFLETKNLRPRGASKDFEKSDRPAQLFGDVWEWTSSPYQPYPGYKPFGGSFAEYNGKFMCNQMVLRGGSCATPRNHIRRTYRNFFNPEARWQFSGLRLAR